jgi:hypothetical protein
METVTVYHSTNTPINKIGIDKKTMFFTGCLDSAKDWGDENYEDYDILEIKIPLSEIYEYTPERPQFAVIDFEQLEVKPEKITGKCVHFGICCDGYIVRDINNYKIV